MKKWICRAWVHASTWGKSLVVAREEVIEAQTRKEALSLFLEKNPYVRMHPKKTASPMSKK